MRKKFSHEGFVRNIGRQEESGWRGKAVGTCGGESAILRFLYRTAPGRIFLKLLVCPGVSKAAGVYLSSRASKWLVPYYIRKHNIDMKGVEIPAGGFTSFNDFFTRKRVDDICRETDGWLLAPCDGWLTLTKIRENTVFLIKGAAFSLEELLEDERLAGQFQDGDALIFRLTPADYHRYCYAADGQMMKWKKISGKLHCVRPIALREFPVFAQNSREYQVIRTAAFGTVVQMEIGALLVGKISNHERSKKPKLNNVQAGEEKGFFEFGGSTIVLLLQKGAARYLEKWEGCRDCGMEKKVHMGERLAQRNSAGSAS